MFNMITGTNECKSLTKHISRKCKCKFDGGKCNSNQKWNNNRCLCRCKKHRTCEKDCIWNPATWTCSIENNELLEKYNFKRKILKMFLLREKF